MAILLAAIFVSSCATVSPGEDKLLVRAQQTYETAVNTFNVLFVLEYENSLLLETKLPGTHVKVDNLRRLAKLHLPRLLRAIDAYATADSGSDLTRALAVVDSLLRDAQDILSNTGG